MINILNVSNLMNSIILNCVKNYVTNKKGRNSHVMNIHKIRVKKTSVKHALSAKRNTISIQLTTNSISVTSVKTGFMEPWNQLLQKAQKQNQWY